MTLDSNDEIISDIYEAAAVPEQWPRVLGKMSARVDGEGGIIFTSVLDRIRWTASPDIYDVFDEFVRDGWAAINPRPARMGGLNHAGFLHDLDAFTIEELDNDPVYTNFLRKRGVGWRPAPCSRFPMATRSSSRSRGPMPRVR